MELRRDRHGRPVGLQWPERPPVAPEIIEKHQQRTFTYSVSRAGMGGRQRSEYCKNGDGPHLMSEWGREKAGGGRYCYKCHLERKAKSKAKGKNVLPIN